MPRCRASPPFGPMPRPTAIALLLLTAAGLSAAVDFDREIRPLLQDRCVECHGPKKNKADLRLDAKTHALKGGESGPAFVAGDPAKSLLFDRITTKDEDKKINGDEEIRCRPDPTKTKGMKFGNYGKVNARGIIPENTLVENRDILIAKVVPIKENRNYPMKIINVTNTTIVKWRPLHSTK